MILQLHPDHGYNNRGIASFGDAIGKDITIEELVKLAHKVDLAIVDNEDGEPNTFYVAHPHNWT